MRRITRSVIVACLFVLHLAQTAFAATETFEISANELADARAQELSLDFSMQGALVSFRRSDDTDLVVRVVVSYDERHRAAPQMVTTPGESFSAKFFSFPTPTDPIMLTGLEYNMIWTITIGDFDVPLDLSILGFAVASSGEVDLGGLSLRNLSVSGAAVWLQQIDFTSPTSTSVENIDVNLTAGAISLMHAGNSDFAELNVAGIATAVWLDLRGDYRSAEHHVGLYGVANATNCVLPSEAGESVDVSGIVALPTGAVWNGTEWNWIPFTRFVTKDYDAANVTVDVDIVWEIAAVVNFQRYPSTENTELDASRLEWWREAVRKGENSETPATTMEDKNAEALQAWEDAFFSGELDGTPSPAGEDDVSDVPEGDETPSPAGEGDVSDVPEDDETPSPAGEGDVSDVPEDDETPSPRGAGNQVDNDDGSLGGCNMAASKPGNTAWNFGLMALVLAGALLRRRHGLRPTA